MTPFENEIEQILTRAEDLLQQEKPTEALDLLDRACLLEPDHAWAKIFRAVALRQLGKTEESIALFIATADGHPDDIDIQVDAAHHLSLMEQHQDALICARRGVEIDESDAGAHAAMAESLEHLGRIREAIPAREAALSLDPDDVDSRYFLAVNYCDMGCYEDAYACALPLFGEFPDDADIVRLHGACLSYIGEHAEALSKWDELALLEGETSNLLHNRASTLDSLGRQHEALDVIGRAIDKDPDMAANYYTRAMIHEHKGDGVAALEDYLAAIERDHDHLDAIMNMLEVTVELGVNAMVIKRLGALLVCDPPSAKLLYARGRLQLELGEFAAAQESIEQAIRREPSLGIAWYTLTLIYAMNGAPEQTLSAAERALRIFPRDVGLWVNRGQALQAMKRYQEALESFDRAISLEPENPSVWLNLGRLLLLDLERPADARGAFKEALCLQPQLDSARWLLALCYVRTGQFDEAAQAVQTLLAKDPDHMWGRLVRAALHTQRGDLDMACDDLMYAASQGYALRLLLNEPLFHPLMANPNFRRVFRRPADGKNDFRKDIE